MSALLDRLHIINPRKAGRKTNPRRLAYIAQFHLAQIQLSRLLTTRLMDQLDLCKSDEARRILLGVSQ